MITPVEVSKLCYFFMSSFPAMYPRKAGVNSIKNMTSGSHHANGSAGYFGISPTDPIVIPVIAAIYATQINLFILFSYFLVVTFLAILPTAHFLPHDLQI
jgi:hypothetical protein